MDNMNMENANDHPFKVSIVKDAEFFANSHPYKVSIEGGGGNEGRVVDELPEEGEPGYIYLVLKESTPEGDIYDEYMWVLQQDGETYGWEHIGATNEVNLDVVKILTEDDYNWNSTTGASGTPDTIALWLLDDGLYKAPDVSVHPVSNHIIGGYTGNLYLVSKAESNSRRGMVACFMGASSELFSAIDDGGNNYLESKFFRAVQQQTGSSTQDLMSQKAITDAINNASGARLLTTDDYNWNTQTQSATEPYNSVALWLLDAGMYYKKPRSGVATLLSKTRGLSDTGGTFTVMPRGTNGTENELQTILYGEELNPELKTLTVHTSDGSEYFSSEKVITTRSVINNLNETYSGYALDARQGKVLNDKIGQIETVLQTLTTGNGA